ncbi:hypothetical protein CT19431_MP30378 [Cupriavidus taiwanensis]|nr:hypothetical protein CT19431_MP30378 [Cupriavidus taiwanensis]
MSRAIETTRDRASTQYIHFRMVEIGSAFRRSPLGRLKSAILKLLGPCPTAESSAKGAVRLAEVGGLTRVVFCLWCQRARGRVARRQRPTSAALDRR